MSSPMTRMRNKWLEQMKAGEIILCALCGEHIPTRPKPAQRISHGGKGGLSVDHIVEKRLGGTDTYDNFQPAHVRCNNEKSNGDK